MTTPLESVFEIKNALRELEKHLLSHDAVVSKRAQVKYEDLVNRFFKEHENCVAPLQRRACLHDLGHFKALLEMAKGYYETEPTQG